MSGAGRIASRLYEANLTIDALRADLRACVAALELLIKWHLKMCSGSEECRLHDTATAAFVRPGVQAALEKL